jgi:hypothetical protein
MTGEAMLEKTPAAQMFMKAVEMLECDEVDELLIEAKALIDQRRKTEGKEELQELNAAAEALPLDQAVDIQIRMKNLRLRSMSRPEPEARRFVAAAQKVDYALAKRTLNDRIKKG